MTQPTPNMPTPQAPQDNKLSPDAVLKIHANSDSDASAQAQHHTLGIGANQAASGSHNHNGKNSKKIGKGVNISFPTTAAATYNQAQIQQIIDALRALGLGT